MLFAGGTRGLRLNRDAVRLEIVDVTDGDAAAAGVLVHDETNRVVAQLLVDMPQGSFPVALGVLYCDPATSFEQAVIEQNRTVAKGKVADLNALIRKGQTWQVSGQPIGQR